MVDDSRAGLYRTARFTDSSEDISDSQSDSEGIKWVRKGPRDIRDYINKDPELYGVRRSSRSRKDCLSSQRLTYGAAVNNHSNVLKRRVQIEESPDESSEESSDEEDEDEIDYRRPVSNSRSYSRSTRGNKVSYKAAFDKASESDEDFISRSPASKSKSQANNFEHPKGSLIRQSTRKSTKSKQISNSGDDDDDLDEEDEEEEDEPHIEFPRTNSSSCLGTVEESDIIEEVLTHDIRRIGSTGNASTFYNIRMEANPNADFDAKKEAGELQYFIKWKNWSHLHSTWETEATLKAPDRSVPVTGLKKLEIYKQRMRESNFRKEQANRDDLEAILYEEERAKQALFRFMEVDRIVAHSRDTESDCFDYLVKWQQLEYRHCTWESGNVIKQLYPNVIDEYKRRCNMCKQPFQKHEAFRIRPKFTRLLDQPDYIGDRANLRLREYQLNGLNWIAHAWTRGNSVILADEMGLGKTIQTICFYAYLFNEFQLYGPFLLVVPLSTVSNWAKEAAIWAPYMNTIVYTGDSLSRQLIREHEWSTSTKRDQGLKFNICITTYEILLKDKTFLSSVQWACLGVDEAHRLKNDSSQLYKCLFTFRTNSRLLITGTPLQNSLKELWALLHFIMPTKFDRWEDFERQYSVADASSEEQHAIFKQLHIVLEPFLLRRVKKDVEYSLPAKIEQILRVEMSSKQADIYRLILARNYDGLQRVTNGNKTSFVNIMMELKKCCNHAYLIAPPNSSDGFHKTATEILTELVRGSGKLMLLDKLLQRLKPRGHRVLIFSQMVRMLDLIADYLELRRWGFQRLDGSISGELRKQALDHFNAEGSSDFCFLLSTRAGGLGINLATADTVIIFDSDWNPQNDLQAQARAHRIGQKKQVSVYRLVTKESIEEKIIESATRKMVLDHLVIQRMDSKKVDLRGKFYTDILKYGAENLFKKDEENNAAVDPDLDIDDILNKAETRDCNDDGPVSQQANALLSTFNIVNIDKFDESEPVVHMDQSSKSAGPKSWEEIIPQNMRDQIKAEEDSKKLLDLELGPRVRKKVNTYQAGADEDEFDSEGAENKFSDKDVRNLVKAMRRFARPLDRIEAVQADAELLDNTEDEIRQTMDLILQRCRALPADQANFVLGRVQIPVKPFLQSIDDLDALHVFFSSRNSKIERLQLSLPFVPKSVAWTCSWTDLDDLALLLGVFEHGMDNWEAIKIDSDLGLGSKIMPMSSSERPQATHLKTRVESLLKQLAKNLNNETNNRPSQSLKMELGKKLKNARTTSTSLALYNHATKSAEFVEDDDDSSSGGELLPSSMDLQSSVTAGKKRSYADDSDDRGASRKKKKKKKSKKDPEASAKPTYDNSGSGPMHFTANKKPTLLQDEEEAQFEKRAGALYEECKREIRPLKKHLQDFDKLEDEESFQEEYIQVVGKIGDHIRQVLKSYGSDKDRRNRRKYHLWRFVKIFSAKTVDELQDLYRKYRERDASASGHSPNNNEHRKHHKKKKHHHKSDSDDNHHQASSGAMTNGHHSHHHGGGSRHEEERKKSPPRYDNAFNRLPSEGYSSHRDRNSNHYHQQHHHHRGSSSSNNNSKYHNNNNNSSSHSSSNRSSLPPPPPLTPILHTSSNSLGPSHTNVRDPRLQF